MSLTTAAFGKTGEQLVAEYLQARGFEIRAMNYRQRCGEIDVIAYKKPVIAFVEVKTRATEYFALSEVISRPKQRKIIKTALNYAAQNQLYEHVLRFDVALLTLNDDTHGKAYSITYIDNAFTASSEI